MVQHSTDSYTIGYSTVILYRFEIGFLVVRPKKM